MRRRGFAAAVPGAVPAPPGGATSAAAGRLAVFALLGGSMCAFAANSILCRLALGGRLIDPVSYTAVRVISGAAMLLAVRHVRGARPRIRFDPSAALALFVYALCFSLAYLSLSAGTGALLLFCAVQLSMIGTGIWRGERPPLPAWLGLATASGGLLYLLAPGVSAPPIGAACLMLLAGAAWGVYSLRGAMRADPLGATTGNFVAAAPLALVCGGAGLRQVHASATGVALALASGMVASALGYIAWYRVLPRLTAMVAASVQLTAPLLTALGGVWLLGERFSMRLGLAGVAILCGLGLVMRMRPHTAQRPAAVQGRASGRLN